MFQNQVQLKEPGHQYFHKETGVQYASVSSVLKKFQPEFDAEKMSFYSARKELKLSGVLNPTEEAILSRRTIVKASWKKKNTLACDAGTRVHNALDLYGKTTRVDDKDLEPMVRAVYSNFSKYKKIWFEQVLYHEKSLVAGTADRVMIRPGAKEVIDIVDYKTNISKGIETESKYGNWMKYFLSHLEDANFIHYTLQLSIYAALIQMQYGYKIGSLKILFVPPDNPLAFKFIPCAYLRNEAYMMIHSHLNPEILN